MLVVVCPELTKRSQASVPDTIATSLAPMISGTLTVTDDDVSVQAGESSTTFHANGLLIFDVAISNGVRFY